MRDIRVRKGHFIIDSCINNAWLFEKHTTFVTLGAALSIFFILAERSVCVFTFPLSCIRFQDLNSTLLLLLLAV